VDGRSLRINDNAGRMIRWSERLEGRVRPLGWLAVLSALGTLALMPPRGCETAASAPSPAPAVTAVPTPAPDLFAASVRPILRERCAPCHEPGGKMYDKLPFDNRQVIAGHPEGVLKRLKGTDREAVEKWLAGLDPSP
jgi:hypothetical protein